MCPDDARLEKTSVLHGMRDRMADPAHDNMSLHEDLDLVVSALVHVQTHVLMTVPRKNTVAA